MTDAGDQTNRPSAPTGDRPVRCPSCGTANRADARWCSNCAQPLGQASAAPNGGSRPEPTTAVPPPTPSNPAPTTPAPTTPSAPTTPAPTPASSAPSTTPSASPTTPVSSPRPAPPAPTTPVAAPPRSPAAPRQSSGRNVNPLLALLVVVLFITTVLFGLMALAPSAAPIKTRTIERAAAGNEEESIRELASRFTQNLLTYKYQTVDADFDRALRDATDEFSSRPLASFGGLTLSRVKSDIKEGRATSTVDVKGAAITSQDSETATVLVVATRTWDSNRRDNAAHTVAVLELTLLNTSDGWKVDNASDPATAS